MKDMKEGLSLLSVEPVVAVVIQGCYIKYVCMCACMCVTPKSFKSCTNCEFQPLKPNCKRLNHEF